MVFQVKWERSSLKLMALDMYPRASIGSLKLQNSHCPWLVVHTVWLGMLNRSFSSYWCVLKKTDTETVHPSYVASFNRGALYKLVAAYLSGLQNTVEVIICWFSWVTVVMFSLGCHSSLVKTQELVQKVVGVQDDTELEIYEQRSLSSIWLSLDKKIFLL